MIALPSDNRLPIKRKLDLLLLFYFVTSFGSILAMISTFIAAESTFGTLNHLALALSLRTFVSIVSSWNAPSIFRKYGIRQVLLISEIFGLMALMTLIYGVSQSNFIMSVTALSLMAIPSNLLSQGVISVVKINCGEDRELFSRYSARMNKVMGLMDIFIGISSPVLLGMFSLEEVYLIDFGSYLLGFVFLLSSGEFYARQSPTLRPVRPLIGSFGKINFPMLRSLFGTLILIGMVPLIAGSKEVLGLFQHSLSQNWLISALWATEGVGLFVSGFIYSNPALRKNLNPLLQLSMLFILLSSLVSSYVILILGCILVTVGYDVNFKSKRDEALMHAGESEELVLQAASSFSIIKAVFCSLSPIVIVSIVNLTSVRDAFLILFVFQLSMLCCFYAKNNAFMRLAHKKARVIE
ncbi:MAG TPA: hypothetical protein VNJ01_03175 [Bacteriovoracaceae bacterium]|nr:hypothetical protein [Bacteriovoracaceae bacterium]